MLPETVDVVVGWFECYPGMLHERPSDGVHGPRPTQPNQQGYHTK